MLNKDPLPLRHKAVNMMCIVVDPNMSHTRKDTHSIDLSIDTDFGCIKRINHPEGHTLLRILYTLVMSYMTHKIQSISNTIDFVNSYLAGITSKNPTPRHTLLCILNICLKIDTLDIQVSSTHILTQNKIGLLDTRYTTN